MSWYELLLSIHILAAALWFGSGLAITAMAYRALADTPRSFSTFAVPAGWWAGRAHPAAGVVLLLTGPAMLAQADISFGEPWVIIGLVGLVALFAIGGAFVGRTSDDLVRQLREGDGAVTPELRPQAQRLLLYTRIESALLALMIVDMVVKPGA